MEDATTFALGLYGYVVMHMTGGNTAILFAPLHPPLATTPFDVDLVKKTKKESSLILEKKTN